MVKATVVLVKNRGYEPTDALKKELQNHVKQVTAPYKYPRIVEFVDELPKTVSGKIQRKLIRRTDADTGADRLIVRPATPDDAEMTLAYLAQIAGESDNLSFGAEGLDMNVEQERGYIEGITGAACYCWVSLAMSWPPWALSSACAASARSTVRPCRLRYARNTGTAASARRW